MAERILVRKAEDVTDVLERLRAHPDGEILLVLPPGAELAESRFNFQLLAVQAEENGQRLVVESEDERVLALAAGAGLATHAGGRARALAAPAPPPAAAIGPVPPFEEVQDDDGEDEGGAGTAGAALPHGSPAYASRFGPWRPEQFAAASRRSPGRDRRRLLFYGAAAAILLIGIAAVVVLVPSATITLTTSSQQFSSPVDLTAQPGSAANGISVRTESAQKRISGTFQATGAKNTPGARASGTIQYQDHCALSLQISQGAVLTSQSGVPFVQQKAVTVDKNQTQTAPIQAQSEGANGNVAAGQITTLQEAGIYASCLKVTNPQPTTGGKDARHQTVITRQDLAAAQTQLQQQAQHSVESQLAADVRPGEKQSDQNPVLFGSPVFTADHPVDSAVGHFDATLTLKGTSSYYRPAQVSSAFRAQLQSRVPSGRQLTPYDFVAQYQTTANAGGSVEFKGQATGRIAPRLDLKAIQGHLAGSSTGSAEAYLHSLPVSNVSISQSPFPFPILPLLKSRISVDYVIQQPPAPSPSPGTSPGASQH